MKKRFVYGIILIVSILAVAVLSGCGGCVCKGCAYGCGNCAGGCTMCAYGCGASACESCEDGCIDPFIDGCKAN